MLKEIQETRQRPGEPRRRWFTSRNLDLYVWLDDAGVPVAFQFCYDKGHRERALTWKRGSGFSHLAVDDGEGNDLVYKGSPILVADGRFEARAVAQRFSEAAAGLPADIVELVLSRLREHPDYR